MPLVNDHVTEPTPAGPARVQVVVAYWEIESGGQAPVVGGSTAWMLEFVPGGVDPLLDHESLWSVSRRDERVTRLDRGPVPAYWAAGAGDPPEPGERRLRGRLQGTAHGGISPDGFPHCAGRVDRIRLLTQQYVEYRERHFRGVPGTVTATDITACPTVFASGLVDGAHRSFGVLLDLAVPVSVDGPAG